MSAQDITDLFSFIKEIVDEIDDKKKAQEGLRFLQNTKDALAIKAAHDERMGQIKF
jgi:hypothetical protein